MKDTKRATVKLSLVVLSCAIGLVIAAYLINTLYLKKSADQITVQSAETSTVTNLPVVTKLSTEAVESAQVLDLDRATAKQDPVTEYAQQVPAIADRYPDPNMPIALEARDLAVGQHVQVRWQIPAGQTFDGVEIYRATTATPQASDLVAEVTADQTDYIDKAVENDVTYYYAVRSFRATNPDRTFSEWSGIQTVLVTDHVPPNSPRHIVISPNKQSPNQLEVTWQPVVDQDLAWYVVYRSSSPASLGSVLTKVASDVTKVIDTTPIPGTRYFYTVTAMDASDNESATQFSIGAYGNANPFVSSTKPL